MRYARRNWLTTSNSSLLSAKKTLDSGPGKTSKVITNWNLNFPQRREIIFPPETVCRGASINADRDSGKWSLSQVFGFSKPAATGGPGKLPRPNNSPRRCKPRSNSPPGESFNLKSLQPRTLCHVKNDLHFDRSFNSDSPARGRYQLLNRMHR